MAGRLRWQKYPGKGCRICGLARAHMRKGVHNWCKAGVHNWCEAGVHIRCKQGTLTRGRSWAHTSWELRELHRGAHKRLAGTRAADSGTREREESSTRVHRQVGAAGRGDEWAQTCSTEVSQEVCVPGRCAHDQQVQGLHALFKVQGLHALF